LDSVRVGNSNSYIGYDLTTSHNDYNVFEEYSEDGYSYSFSSSDDRSIDIEMYDEDAGIVEDYLYFKSINVTVHYTYSVALQNGEIAASGRIYANNNTQVGDIAEYFPLNGGNNEAGLIVSLKAGDNNKYKLSDMSYDQFMVGVISENPSILLNSAASGIPIALTGRVKVKLIPSDKLIKSGDFLTSSNLAGYAELATQAGPVIGYAVENQNPDEDFVQILIQPGRFYMPTTQKHYNDSPNPDNKTENRLNSRKRKY
jgi:hypothetical protein